VLLRRIDMISDERAAFAHMIGSRRQHEVIDRELAAALEQIRKRAFALRSFEHVRLLDFDPGKPTTFGAKRIELVRYGFLLEEDALRVASHSSRDTTFGEERLLVAMINSPLIAD
jgi:hypothetical protein